MSDPFDPAPVQKQLETNLRQPKGLWVLFITEMWERFSYYGMRALLMLYLVSSTSAVLSDGSDNWNPGFGWTKDDASVLFGLYTGAVYLTPLLGGWLADRFLGTHRSMLVGGWIIAAGHITLAMTELFGITAGEAVTFQTGPGAYLCFMGGLVLIVVGTGFFKPCVSVMVGQLYAEGDERRDSGFTIFYMGINLGAFFSPLVAGTLGEKVGWHWGFGSAAVGMIAGLLFYQKFRPKYLGDIGMPPNRDADSNSGGGEVFPTPGEDETSGSKRLTGVEWQRLAVILVLAFLGNILFWAAFEQAGTSMTIFAKERTDRTLGGMVSGEGFPASWYQSINPLAILLFAPFFSWLWVWLNKRKINPPTPMKFALGLYLLGLAFLAMVAASFRSKGGELAGPHWLLITYVVYTWGELCLSPVGLSMVTKLTPLRLQSLMMGVWFLSFALANTFGGLIAAFSTKMDTSRHVVEMKAEELYADVKIDARSKELVVLMLKKDKQAAQPIKQPQIELRGDLKPEEGDSTNATVVLKAKPQTGEKEGESSRFVIPLKDLPANVNDVEQIHGKVHAKWKDEEASGEIVHDHFTFVYPGLAGFYLMLVVFPLAGGLLITLLTPMLKKMMHGVQ